MTDCSTSQLDCDEFGDDGCEDQTEARKADEVGAKEFERKVQAEADAQFRRLKDEARAIYGLVRGRPGVRSPKQWQALLEQAGDDLGNGRFLVGWLGAERYLDPATVAALITLRQSLLAECRTSNTVTTMVIDCAVVAYYNMLRTQAWIGDLALAFERDAFGQASLDEVHGPDIAVRLEDHLRRLREEILPLQDRAQRMLIKSLGALR